MFVGGCSGGGVPSSWVIGHTDRFAAAAVRRPVIDWLSFAGQTDIPLFTYNFFEKPFWEDPAAWLKQSSLMYVGNVKTPTMVMTGVLDQRTPMPQSEEYYSALKMRGIPAVLLRFENEWHGTSSRPSNWMRTQLYMMSWYNKWAGRSPQFRSGGSRQWDVPGCRQPATGSRQWHRDGWNLTHGLPAVGRSVPRKDGLGKATGETRYADDLSFPGMLYGRTIRSTIPCGTIRDIRLEFDPAGFTTVDWRDIPGRNVVAPHRGSALPGGARRPCGGAGAAPGP